MRERRTAGVSGAEDAANASAGNVRNGDVIFFKNLEDAKMREAACKSATESKSHAWPRRVIGKQRVTLERCTAAKHGADEAVGLGLFL